jgi:2-amino-4-hydroxy-6-hydroxymethyldihydropteridine diphosphokinase
MSGAASIELPAWARVSLARRQHIARVTALLMQWADALQLPSPERAAWHDAGMWHDALRDAPEGDLRARSGNDALPVGMLHGPAAAAQLAGDGEQRATVLEAIRWHTVGNASWDRTGRALYMADYLEPERRFARVERAYLATQVPYNFEGTFRQVVRHRLEWALHEGHELYPNTVELWNSLR